jgi:hypothetical protein
LETGDNTRSLLDRSFGVGRFIEGRLVSKDCLSAMVTTAGPSWSVVSASSSSVLNPCDSPNRDSPEGPPAKIEPDEPPETKLLLSS